MARITFIEHGGTVHTIDVAPGSSLMEGAVRHDIPGIAADCGGALACGTCHVYIDEGPAAVTGARTPAEEAMLEMAETVTPSSRLACQVRVTEDMDGLVVRIPEKPF